MEWLACNVEVSWHNFHRSNHVKCSETGRNYKEIEGKKKKKRNNEITYFSISSNTISVRNQGSEVNFYNLLK